MAGNQRKKSSGKPSCTLPIPIADGTYQQPRSDLWNYYHGTLEDNSVVVSHSGDAKSIYCMGYFGKGLLSKTIHEYRIEASKDSGTVNSVNKVDRIEDRLYLSFEESFFLSYALGCLFILNSEKELDIQEQWTTFCTIKPNFPVLYAAYHHFRSKGWVPREGLKFGVDFVLYKYGPAYYHASYAVKVIAVNDQTDMDKLAVHSFSWQTLSGLSRLATSVSKDLLLCHAILNGDAECKSPQCLQRIQISEIAFSRWISAKDREKENKDIDAYF